MRAIKNKTSKLFLLGIVGALALSPAMVAASCGSSSNNLNSEGELTIAVTAGNDNELKSKNAALAGFLAANPGIKAKYILYTDRVQNLISWAASGDMPDIVMLDSGEFPELAASKTIVPIDGNKLPVNKTFGGLAANVLAPFVGKVTSGEYQSATPAALSTESATIGTGANSVTLDFTKATGAIPDTYSVYGLPKDFSTLVSYINRDYLKTPSEALPTSFASLSEYTTFAKAKLNKPTKTNQKGDTAIIGSQYDFAREIGMMDTTFYNQYKDSSKAALKQAYPTFSSGLAAALPQSVDLFNLRKEGTIATPTEHKYGWNGEAFDNNAVATIFEGNWYTPAKKDNVSLIPINGISPIYYTGWALTTSLNDSDAAYKFLDYMAFGEGAKIGAWNGGQQGFLPAARTQLQAIYTEATAIVNDTVKSKTDEGFVANSFLTHAKTLVNARPNLFTRAYSEFLASWGDEGFKPVLGATDTFASRLAKVIDGFKNKLN